MSVRSRLGLAALGSYLASVGTVLAFGVPGDLPPWLSRELPWGIPMGAVVSVAALASGVCLVFGAVSQRSGPAAHGQTSAGLPEEPRVVESSSSADYDDDANRTTRGVAETASRGLVRENRAPSGPRSAERVSGPSELAVPRHAPEATLAQSVPASGREGERPAEVKSVGEGSVVRSSADVSAPALLSPDALVCCWRHYRDEGDGHFRAAGLRAELTERGCAAEVLEGRDVGAGDDVLVVPTGAPDGACYLVPSFAKSPGAVGRWFEDRGDRSLSRRVNDVVELAVGRRTEDGLLEVRKGAVS